MYAAPEFLKTFDNKFRAKQKYSPKIDIWAVGMILLQTYLGRNPLKEQQDSFFNDSDFGFRLKNVKKLLKDLHHQPYTIFGKDVKKRFVDFIQKCLAENPEDRWSAFQLQHHKWLESVVNADRVSAVERLTYKEMLKFERWKAKNAESESSSGFPNSGSFTFN